MTTGAVPHSWWETLFHLRYSISALIATVTAHRCQPGTHNNNNTGTSKVLCG
jgi:hypothetical protein